MRYKIQTIISGIVITLECPVVNIDELVELLHSNFVKESNIDLLCIYPASNSNMRNVIDDSNEFKKSEILNETNISEFINSMYMNYQTVILLNK